LGVLADWEREYKTKAPAFEAEILRAFATFVERGLVERSKKPVYWSIPFETALAEAEIEYKEHVSLSIWVKFRVTANAPSTDAADNTAAAVPANTFFVIWTTTPWTIPANLAIAVHPELEYVEVHHGDETYIVADALAAAFIAACKLEGATLGTRRKGRTLEGTVTRHPFIDRPSPVVLADYVTTESGTGCVHTAPGHGSEDYQTGLRNGLPIYCPVGDDGRYLDDGQVPADLVGLTCLETVEDLAAKRTSPANIAVLKKLAAAGALLAKTKFTHSYPHCWRSKTPIIFRAVDQWFVRLGKADAPDSARAAALAAINNVAWTPAFCENRIRAAVESRPDWCVSRQRSWGVPIPAFYEKETKTPYLDANVIRAVAQKIATAGTNLWFTATPAELLAGIALPADWPAPENLFCGRDTLDVWLDSGSSHLAVLASPVGGVHADTKNTAPDLHWPADLYLEGSDQHRGWFQSSLWTAVIARGTAPYKHVLTHGFIVAKDGKKISKSGEYEKPPTSENYVNAYGADIIRFWVASQDFTQDITVSDLDADLKDKASILNIVANQYRGIRNTLRYQLSNLYDFDPRPVAAGGNALPADQLTLLDRWALAKTADLVHEVTTACDNYEFHKAYSALTTFSSATLSATYHNILKDRLYTLAPADPRRRSAQTAIHQIFETLVRLLTPFLPFTADEAWSFHKTGTEYTDTESALLLDWPDENSGKASSVGGVHAASASQCSTDYRAAGDIGHPVCVAGVSAEGTHHASASAFEQILRLAATVNTGLETLRQNKTLGQSLDAAVVITADPADPTFALLRHHHADDPALLAETFIVSEVRLEPAATAAPLDIVVVPATGDRCPRCWRHVPLLVPAPAPHSDSVCPRCAAALKSYKAP
jgi:isoleucyl-tRNA synthetase